MFHIRLSSTGIRGYSEMAGVQRMKPWRSIKAKIFIMLTPFLHPLTYTYYGLDRPARNPTVNNREKLRERNSSSAQISDRLLQSSNWVSLDNLPCWLRLHHDNFAKDFALARFRRWLCPELKACQSRDREDASLLDFFGSNASKFVEDLRALRLLQFCCCGKCFGKSTLGHGGSCLLHWCHCVATTNALQTRTQQMVLGKPTTWVCKSCEYKRSKSTQSPASL